MNEIWWGIAGLIVTAVVLVSHSERQTARRSKIINIKHWLKYRDGWKLHAESFRIVNDTVSSNHCLLNAENCLENAKRLGYLKTITDADLEEVKIDEGN